MKKISYAFVLIIFYSAKSFAAWGLFEADRSWIGVDFNGTNNNYRIYNAGTVSGSGYFNGSYLGEFMSQSQTLAISFWDIKTWKNDVSNVTGCALFYRIYEQGQSGGDFTMILGNWIENLVNPGDQKWGKSSSTYIDIGGLLAGKTYLLELYIHVYGDNPVYIYPDNNGGSNYIATFTTNSSFPVELISFQANIHLLNVNLKWKTATEINNYGFDVERSQKSNVKNQMWEKIGFVSGQGNSNSPKNYSFIDEDVLNGKYFYRLKQIDNDGKYEYSKEVEVNVESVPTEYGLFQNYPNPFNPNTTIKYAVPTKQLVQLKVFNVLGNEVASLVNEIQDAGTYKVEFNSASVKNPTSGIYFYRLEAGSFVESRKMTLLK